MSEVQILPSHRRTVRVSNLRICDKTSRDYDVTQQISVSERALEHDGSGTVPGVPDKSGLGWAIGCSQSARAAVLIDSRAPDDDVCLPACLGASTHNCCNTLGSSISITTVLNCKQC